MTTHIRLASDDEIAHVLGWTHALWGGERDLAGYVARTRRILATDWGRERYRFWLGVDERDVPVCACKLYRFDVVADGVPTTAIGFGAVFTRPDARGRGHAADLLNALNDRAAAEGHGLALLYSDIGPAYYQRLGFEPLGGLAGTALAVPGPPPFRPLLAEDEPLLASWWAAMAARPAFQAFRYARDPVYFSYLLERNEDRVWAYAPDDGPPRGFLVADIRRDRLLVEEAGWADGVEDDAFWLGVRALAGAELGPGAWVRGWLPPGAAGFVLKPIEDGLPMVKALDGRPAPRAEALWGLDHF